MIAIRFHKALCLTLLVSLGTAALPSMAEEASSSLSSSLSSPSAEDALPDAPLMGVPMISPNGGSQAPAGTATPVPEVFAPRFAKEIEPGQTARPLGVGGKVAVSFLEQARLYALLSVIASAGWEHLLNNDPKYGTDSAGFGERVGAAAILQTSEAIFTDGIAASVFHQDTRYYRMGSEHGFIHRAFYAATRVVVTRGNSGSAQLNVSELVGYAGGAVLTRTYYPAVSNTWSDTAIGYAGSLGGSALGNEVTEFGFGLVRRVFHRNPTP